MSKSKKKKMQGLQMDARSKQLNNAVAMMLYANASNARENAVVGQQCCPLRGSHDQRV